MKAKNVLIVFCVVGLSCICYTLSYSDVISRGAVFSTDKNLIGSFQAQRSKWIPVECVDVRKGETIRFVGYVSCGFYTMFGMYYFKYTGGKAQLSFKWNEAYPDNCAVIYNNGVADGVFLEFSDDLKLIKKNHPTVRSIALMRGLEERNHGVLKSFKNLQYLFIESDLEEAYSVLDSENMELISSSGKPSDLGIAVTKGCLYLNCDSSLSLKGKQHSSDTEICLYGSMSNCLRELKLLSSPTRSVSICCSGAQPQQMSELAALLKKLQTENLYLSLYWNYGEEAPQNVVFDMQNLQSLISLHLGYRTYKKVSFTNTQMATKLKHLSLDSVKTSVTSLTFPNLRYLDASYALISSHPEEKTRLKSVKVLNMGSSTRPVDESLYDAFPEIECLHISPNMFPEKPRESVKTLIVNDPSFDEEGKKLKEVKTVFPSLQGMTLYRRVFNKERKDLPKLNLDPSLRIVEIHEKSRAALFDEAPNTIICEVENVSQFKFFKPGQISHIFSTVEK